MTMLNYAQTAIKCILPPLHQQPPDKITSAPPLHVQAVQTGHNGCATIYTFPQPAAPDRPAALRCFQNSRAWNFKGVCWQQTVAAALSPKAPGSHTAHTTATPEKNENCLLSLMPMLVTLHSIATQPFDDTFSGQAILHPPYHLE